MSRERDDRLLDLLVSMGHLESDAAEACRHALWAARQRDPEAQLLDVLRRQGHVSDEVLADLLGAALEVRRSGEVPGLGQGGDAPQAPLPPRVASEDSIWEEDTEPLELPLIPLGSASGSGAALGKAPSAIPGDGSAAPQDPRAGVAQSLASDEGDLLGQAFRARQAARQGERTGQAPPQDLAEVKADGTARISRDQLQRASLSGERLKPDTRKLDGKRLAAASRRTKPGRPPGSRSDEVPGSDSSRVLSGAALIAAGVLLVSFGLWSWSQRSSQTVPELAESPTPLEDDPFDGEDEPLVRVDPLRAVREEAKELEERELYRRARGLWSNLPRHVRTAHALEVMEQEDRYTLLEQLQIRALEAMNNAKRLRQEGDLAGALREVEITLTAVEELGSSPTGSRLLALQSELARELAKTAPPEVPSPTPEPPKRRKVYERLAAEGKQQIEKLRALIAQQKAEQASEAGGELARARQASQDQVYDVPLRDGPVVMRARLERFDDYTVSLKIPSGVSRYPWSDLEPQAALMLRRLAVRPSHGRDHFRLGVWCLRQRMFAAAREAFQQAGRLDTSLLSRLPDVDEVERRSALFPGGDMKLAGQRLTLSYPFQDSSEGVDWYNDEGCLASPSSSSGLVVRGGPGLFFTRLRPLGPAEQLTIELELGPDGARTARMFGVFFAADTEYERGYLVRYSSRRQQVRLNMLLRGQAPLHKDGIQVRLQDGDRVVLEIRGSRLELRLKGERTPILREEIDADWRSCRVAIGGWAFGRRSGASGSAAYRSLKVETVLREDWLRKIQGEVNAMISGLAAGSDELPVLRQRRQPRPAEPPLSAEDDYVLGPAGADAVTAYRRGVDLLASRTGDPSRALEAFYEALELAPNLAAAHYRQGLIMERFGRQQAALRALNLAVQHFPRFYEAHAARGRVLLGLRRPGQAREALEKALELGPTWEPAWAAYGLLTYYEGKTEEALEAHELALALDPWDDEARGRLRNVRHVLRGPPWREDRRHRAESEHYIVRSNVSLERCREYAEQLEALRQLFVERFGQPAQGGAKAEVLVFDTKEGFHSYAERTTNDRGQDLQGLYVPGFRQLLLYERSDDPHLEQTRQVLFHESFHQFVDALLPELPIWMNEGLAEFYSTVEIAGGQAGREGGLLLGRLQDLRLAIEQRGPTPFRTLMLEDPQAFYSGAVAAKYAQAWAMVHFFLSGPKLEATARFKVYLEALFKGQEPKLAFQQAWGDADWSQLEADFKTYVGQL